MGWVSSVSTKELFLLTSAHVNRRGKTINLKSTPSCEVFKAIPEQMGTQFPASVNGLSHIVTPPLTAITFILPVTESREATHMLSLKLVFSQWSPLVLKHNVSSDAAGGPASSSHH